MLPLEGRMMKRFACILPGMVLLTLVPALGARFVVDEYQQVTWDFTQPRAIESLVRWTDPEHLAATSDGLGWTGAANETRDVRISARSPTAVGWAWHTVSTVSIQAEVVPAGDLTFSGNSVTFPHTAGVL
jgi:hypothetical protein